MSNIFPRHVQQQRRAAAAAVAAAAAAASGVPPPLPQPTNDAATASTANTATTRTTAEALAEAVPGRRLPRKTRAELNTGNAQAERRERQAPLYDALEVPAPLAPSTEQATTKFEYDQFIKTRQVTRRYVHGADVDRNFDPENFDLLPDTGRNRQYKDRLRTDRLGLDKGQLPELEQELQAAIVVPTQMEWAQLQHDLANPDFIKDIRGDVIRPTTQLTEVERARRLNDAAAQKERQETLQRAFLEQTARLRDNPDFYTGLSDRVQQVAGGQVLADDDDESADGEESGREQQEAGNGAPGASATAPRVAPHEGENAPVPISTDEARQLLVHNPLTRLQHTMHRDFLMLPEVAHLWQLLFPLQLQQERHKRDYNAVEFIRAMNMCGAKYDSCVLLSVTEPLGQLVDQQWFAPYLDKESGRLGGAHEHYDEERRRTVLAVFKFFCVRRNKGNVGALSKYALHDDKRSNLLNTDAFDPNAVVNRSQQYTALNKGGLYDADNVDDNDTDDGTSEYGSLHEIRNLAKEFMFCIRVVCAVPAPPPPPPASAEDASGDREVAQVNNAADDDDNDYVSIEDQDFVLPATFRPPGIGAPPGEDATADDCVTVGPEHSLHLDDANDAGVRPNSVTARLDELQPTTFDDGDDDGAAPELSSEPREILVSDATALTTTTNSRTRGSGVQQSVAGTSTNTTSALFGGNAGSVSDGDDDDDDGGEEDDVVERRRARRVRGADITAFNNTERFGVRFEDVQHDEEDADEMASDASASFRMADADGDMPRGASLSMRAAAASSVAAAAAVDPFDVHSDDGDAVDAASDADSSAEQFRPDQTVTLDAAQARRLVGKWKAPDIMKKINQRYLTRLCVRAYAFYAVTLPVEATAVGSKKK